MSGNKNENLKFQAVSIAYVRTRSSKPVQNLTQHNVFTYDPTSEMNIYIPIYESYHYHFGLPYVNVQKAKLI